MKILMRLLQNYANDLTVFYFTEMYIGFTYIEVDFFYVLCLRIFFCIFFYVLF